VNCFKHSTAAIAICAFCGRGLCDACVQSDTAPRMACSADCSAALLRADQAIQLVVRRSAQSARASAFYCYVTAGLSAAAAVVAWFMLPSPFLIFFTSGCALVLLTSGIWHGRAAQNQNP
jgi:hypothetical protein